jgi:hypothetical protein|tara:strand:+ start:174 stop:323 length:150 start_codon:yes stop_codon:yes gene_type:complete
VSKNSDEVTAAVIAEYINIEPKEKLSKGTHLMLGDCWIAISPSFASSFC